MYIIGIFLVSHIFTEVTTRLAAAAEKHSFHIISRRLSFPPSLVHPFLALTSPSLPPLTDANVLETEAARKDQITYPAQNFDSGARALLERSNTAVLALITSLLLIVGVLSLLIWCCSYQRSHLNLVEALPERLE